MKNDDLVRDHLKRAKSRLAAIRTLIGEQSWADVVGESQEVVELTLKALLRSAAIAPPRVHDVSQVLESECERLPADLHSSVPRLSEISRQLRRDRELAFYGSEDLTPSEFYREADATRAYDQAVWVFETTRAAVGYNG